MVINSDSELSTRDRLLEAAISVISAEGEGAIRVDRVAELAGFTKPVLYHYFDDREGLIAAAQAERFRRSLDIGLVGVIEEAEKATTAEEYLEVTLRWLKSLLGPDGEERRKFRIEVLGSAVSRPALLANVIEVSRVQADRFAVHLRIAESRGWLKPDVRLDELARWWTGVILSRHVFEIDKERYSPTGWDKTTEFVMRAMLTID